MRKLATVVAMLMLSEACAHFRVAPDNVSSATVEEQRRVKAMAWGALEPLVAPANCNGNGMASVMVTMTPGDSLIGVVTLGLVRPATIEWTCAKALRSGEP